VFDAIAQSDPAQIDAADATLRQVYPDTHGQVDPSQSAQSVPLIPIPVVQASETREPAPQQVQPQIQQPPPPAPQGEETWEQRYRSLQGIHNSHVGDLKARLTQAEATITQLTEQLRALPPAAQPQPAVVNPQDAETFGEDLVQMIQRTTERVLGPVAQSVEQRLAQLEGTLQGTNQVVAKTADERSSHTCASRCGLRPDQHVGSVSGVAGRT
jgi:hypothetical protein